MIQNQWYGVLASKEVKKGKITYAKRLNEKMIFFRDRAGKVNCIADQCCHRGASLSLGRHCGNTVACPFHGIEYNGEGKAIKIPANGTASPVPPNFKVKAYPVREEHGIIWLWYGEKPEVFPPIRFFDELDEMSYSQIIDPWSVHYSRCIENQLDAAHLPFVHKNTIGRGNKTVVFGPKVIYEEDTMTFYVHNEVDDGIKTGKKPGEITDYHDWFSLQFRFPNIWQNRIAPKMRIFAVFAPIDEENSMVYIRYYQGYVNVPALKQITNLFGKVFSNVVLKQDKRVVITQLPKKSELHMKENLFPGDSPIIEYRKIRQKLKEQNQPASR